MTRADRFTVDLPPWAAEFARTLPGRLATTADAMHVAVALARRNMEEETGGPFGALVISRDTGEWVSLGVNRVEPAHCSAAHAEIVALSLAQRRSGTWNLSEVAGAPLMLVSSCEPCAMCLGAIPWSGVAALACGALREDAQAAGFDEGERATDWMEGLARRGIRVETGICRERAVAVLAEYRSRGRTIYNP